MTTTAGTKKKPMKPKPKPKPRPKPRPRPRPKPTPTPKPKPAFAPFKPLTTAQAKAVCGDGRGSFPSVNGKNFKYPAATNEAAWTRLVNQARLHAHKCRLAYRNGKPEPRCKPKRKYEYVLYGCSPRSKQKRAIRNKHRAMHGLRVGDTRVVHHDNQTTMSFASTKVLTPCQHKAVHGKRCANRGR